MIFILILYIEKWLCISAFFATGARVLKHHLDYKFCKNVIDV